MDITNRQKLLEQVPLFRTLNSEITEKLASRLEESLCQTNHAIFQSGEIAPALFIVEEGMVALINTVDHQETTLAQLGPGNYLNEQLLDWGRPHTLSARALEPCRILKLSQSAVETILQETYGVKFNLERFFVEQAEALSIADSLKQALIFRNLSSNDLSRIASKITIENHHSGDTIIRKGDDADRMYFIKSGEVRVSMKVDGVEKELAYLRRGEPFGEMALLTSQPRSADVISVLDCELLVLHKKDFDQIVQERPTVLLELSKVLSLRLKLTQAQKGLKRQYKFLALISTCDPVCSQLAGWHLAQAIYHAEGQRTVFIDANFSTKSIVSRMRISCTIPTRQQAFTPGGEWQYSTVDQFTLPLVDDVDLLPLQDWIHQGIEVSHRQLIHLISYLKEKYDVVILDFGAVQSSKWPWVEINRQSDIQFVLLDNSEDAALTCSNLLLTLEDKNIDIENRVQLVSMPTEGECKKLSLQKISELLKKRIQFQLQLPESQSQEFIQSGQSLLSSQPEFSDDLHRIIRWLCRKRIGLALGGGGSRGFAHIGVIRALQNAGIPIDLIAGTSMGALIGAEFAMGLTVEQMIEINREEWVKKKPLKDYIFPKSALLGGKKVWRMMERIFGNKTFEDFKIPCFAVSADLISGEEVVLRSGPLVPAIRASMSLPGIGLPVSYQDKYLVDGGVINNLPADVLKQNGADIVIAVNVTPKKEEDLFSTPEQWPWFLRPFKKNKAMREFLAAPSIFKILIRSLRLSTSRQLKQLNQDIDFYISPDIHGIGLFSFNEIEEVVRRGELASQTVIGELVGLFEEKNTKTHHTPHASL